MSESETLLRAAAQIRNDRGGIVSRTTQSGQRWLAVADWLESTANDVEHVHSPIYNLTSTTVARALKVARVYLGEPA